MQMLWQMPVLEEIPVPGFATPADWRGTAPGTTRRAGRNHPQAGAWLYTHYAGQVHAGGYLWAADPMMGPGGLWLRTRGWTGLYGADCEAPNVDLARANLPGASICQADARAWLPPEPADLVMTSPVFRQSKSSGATQNQRDRVEQGNLHNIQEFGDAPENLANLPEPLFWIAVADIYRNIALMLRGPQSRALVLLRNRIKDRIELPIVDQHVETMRHVGLEPIGVHPRALQPTRYQQLKLWHDPTTPWTRWEWTVVARRQV